MRRRPGRSRARPAQRSITRSSSALLLANLAAGIVALAFAVVVARTLGPSGRGIVALATTITIAASWLSLLGLDVAFLYYCGSRADLRPAIASSAVVGGLITGLAGAAVGWIVFEAVPGLTPTGFRTSLLAAALLAAPLVSIQRLFNAVLIGCERIAVANAIVVALPVMALLAYLMMAATVGPGTGIAVAAWVCSRSIGAVASIALAWRSIGFGRGAAFREAMALTIRYGIRAYPGSIAQQPIRRLDTFVLAAVAPASQLGFYAAAVSMSEVGMYLPNAVASVLLPRSAGMPERAAAATIHRASTVVLALVMAGSFAGILLADPLVAVLLGERFGPAIIPLRLLLIAMVGAAARRTFGAGLMARDRAGLVSMITVFTMILIVLLDLALIPPFGASGAAAASMVAYCAGAVAAYVAYRRTLHPDVRRTLLPFWLEFRAGLADVRRAISSRRNRSGSSRSSVEAANDAGPGGDPVGLS